MTIASNYMQAITNPAMSYNHLDLMQMNAYMMGAPYPIPTNRCLENTIPSLNSLVQFQNDLMKQGKIN